MPIVNIKGVGPAEFPEGMGVDDIREFLRNKYSQQVVRNTQPLDLNPIQATAQAYEPSLAERAGQGISDALYDTGIVSDRYGAQRIGDNVATMGEFLPVIGDAAAGDEFGRALKQGDGIGMALGALGAVPIAGDLAKKAGKITSNTPVGFMDELGVLSEQLPRDALGNLSGLPTNIKGYSPRHNRKIADTAKRYMDSIGLDYSPSTQYAKINPENSKSIANEFDRMKHDPQNPEVKEAYDEMIKEVKLQYQAALDDGLKVDFIDFDKMGDPYAKSPRMANEDIEKNNHMYVFPTKSGFGSDDAFDPQDNPLLQETEFMINGQPALANDLFRVVHDYFGHAKEGLGFRADGEENAWRAHAAMFSPKARRAMTTETRGQNSWVNYGKYGDRNRNASAADTIFADQKIGLLPEWVSNGMPRPPELNEVNHADFYKAIKDAKENNKNAPFLTSYSPEEYKSMRTFLTPDGDAGYAIKSDGDLVSVFKSPKSKINKAMDLLIPDAISRGASRLDAFEGFLTDSYNKYGFNEVGRDSWNDAYKPNGWSYELGTPDVVYMERR